MVVYMNYILFAILLLLSTPANARRIKTPVAKCPTSQVWNETPAGSGCTENGTKMGEWQIWNESAKRFDFGPFNHNVKVGEWREWEKDPEGYTYVWDTLFKDIYRRAQGGYMNGKRNGPWNVREEWNKFGSDYQSGNYIDGTRVGAWYSRGITIQYTEKPPTKDNPATHQTNRVFASVLDRPEVKLPMLWLTLIGGVTCWIIAQIVAIGMSVIKASLWPAREIVRYLTDKDGSK